MPPSTVDVPRGTRAAQPAGHRVRPHAALPPGPDLGALRQGAWFHRDPLGMIRSLAARHGDVFTLRMPTEGAVVVVCAPDGAAALAEASPLLTHGGEGRRRILGMAAPRSVLGADAGRHAAARARIAHVFTAQAVGARRPLIAQIAERHVAGWPTGRPMRLLPRMRALCDEAFARAVVGIGDEHDAARLAALVQRMLWTPGNPPLSPPGDDDGLLGRAGARLFARRAAPVRALLARELDRRDAAGDERGDDLLGALRAAGLEREALLDEALPLLMAGQEPPAAALSWLADRLAREPQAAGVVREAPESPESDLIRREALRLRPPVAAVMRRVMAPTRVDGTEIPAGAVTMLPLAFLHHDPRTWAAPEAFRPQRFAALGPEEPPSYLPFGAGARRCLGEHLAHAELDLVLPAILRRLDLRPVLPAPERMVVRGTVHVPLRGALVVARRR